jgi:hypothetical protein
MTSGLWNNVYFLKRISYFESRQDGWQYEENIRCEIHDPEKVGHKLFIKKNWEEFPYHCKDYIVCVFVRRV